MAKVIIKENGTKIYYNDDEQEHRDDGPAIISVNGDRSWLTRGLLDNDDIPSVLRSTGAILWYKDFRPCRKNGPAFDFPTGHKMWMDTFVIWPKL